jgi:hypothetical protein
MWQADYHLYQMRMRELEVQAERRRRWELQDRENGRTTTSLRARHTNLIAGRR